MGKQELLRTAVVWRVGEATRSGIPVYREAMDSAKIAPHKVATESRVENGTRGGNVCREYRRTTPWKMRFTEQKRYGDRGPRVFSNSKKWSNSGRFHGVGGVQGNEYQISPYAISIASYPEFCKYLCKI